MSVNDQAENGSVEESSNEVSNGKLTKRQVLEKIGDILEIVYSTTACVCCGPTSENNYSPVVDACKNSTSTTEFFSKIGTTLGPSYYYYRTVDLVK